MKCLVSQNVTKIDHINFYKLDGTLLHYSLYVSHQKIDFCAASRKECFPAWVMKCQRSRSCSFFILLCTVRLRRLRGGSRSPKHKTPSLPPPDVPSDLVTPVPVSDVFDAHFIIFSKKLISGRLGNENKKPD
jgi:hypothetical protein